MNIDLGLLGIIKAHVSRHTYCVITIVKVKHLMRMTWIPGMIPRVYLYHL